MKNVERIEGIIFDLGKTLMYIPEEYNFENKIADLINWSSEKVEIYIYDLCHKNLNLSAKEFIELIYDKLGSNISFKNKLRKACWDSVINAKLQHDAEECLRTLKNRGFKLTLISNTSPLSKIRIQELGIKKYFDHIVFSCDIGYLKPDPRIFLHAIKLMETKPASICIVGDKIRTIILGGAIIGTKLILVERRINQTIISNQIPVDAIVPNLYDLINLPMLIKNT